VGCFRNKKDLLSGKVLFGLTISFNILFILIVILLYVKSGSLFRDTTILSVLTGSEWQPFSGKFGMRYFIAGTMFVTLLSIIIAAPLGILISVFLSEYAPKSIAAFSKSVIDIFAGIPSVVYGIWGVIFVVPFIKWAALFLFGKSVTGYSLIAAGIVLSIMILPIIINIITELIDSLPPELKESSLALGATRWQTVKHVILRKVYPGIFAAIVLGISRAFGETMAVMMVAGNVAAMPGSMFDPVYTMSSLIANNYGEMMSIPMYDSALMFVSLVLMVIVMLFNSAAQMLLFRTRKRLG
jgi:phosphate transport system permease protein